MAQREDRACLDLSNAISQTQYEQILALQQELFRLIAYESETQNVLNRLCEIAESLLPNAVASLMLFDPQNNTLSFKAAPSIPKDAQKYIGEITPSPHGGSCANAIYHGEAQYIYDVLSDERSCDFAPKAKELRLCSCWSTPIKNESHASIGSFALSSFEHREPELFHKKLLEVCSTVATVALKSEKMVLYDALTGLKNKLSLQKEIKKRAFNTLIFLDVNNFSYINAAYSFKIGDEILAIIASMLQKLFGIHQTYRINSDQFAILLPYEADITQEVARVQELFLDATLTTRNINLKISFNYGGVYANRNLLKHAALALKKSKERGKNRLYIYNKTLDDSKKRAAFIAMNSTIYAAFENNLITPYFQGIYDNYLGKITKYEALVRITTKEGKIISPYELLGVAKLSGLLPKLTQIMIDKSFAFMSLNDFDFSINITEEDLNSQYLLEFLLEASQRYKIEPYRVTLEILEGVSASGKADNIVQLKKIKQKGFKLSIDDFGAEYSNFERVLELDVDTIKIDARYIKNIDKDKKSYEITKAIVNFAKNMQIALVAEFVHSEGVQEIIKDLGIDYSQGYYFSEPSTTLIS